MERSVEQVLRELQEAWEEHKLEHPDCPAMADDAFPLTDPERAEFLGLIAESAKRGLISPEDEMELEVAVGTYGEPECFGWPATTTNLERLAVVGILGKLFMALHGGPGGLVLETLAEAIKAAREGGVPEEGFSFQSGDTTVHMIPVPDEIAKQFEKKLTKPSDDDDAADWFKQGYL